ncbi:helix-turn-helix transcriptional regulator [Achromobacter denitrificans]
MENSQSACIVHQLYESLLDESAFQPAVAALGAFMGNRRTMLLSWNGCIGDKPDVVSTHAANGPSFESFLRHYGDYYHQFDPSKFKWAAVREGDWLHEDRSLAPAAWSSNGSYQDFALAQRVTGWAVLKLCAGRPDASAPGWALTFMRDTGDPELDPGLLAQMRLLGPHLRRTLLLRDRLAVLRSASADGLAALQRFQIPLWLLESGGRVQFANEAAQRHLRSANAMLQARSGVLLPVDGRQRMRWDAMVGGARPTQPAPAGGLALTGKSGGKGVAQCLPLSCGVRAAADWRRPLRMLVLHDAAGAPHPRCSLLRQIYGFTPAEIRIGMDLITDATIAEIAHRAGTRPETVRGQVKSMLHKTGCRRQAELVRLLYGIHEFG